MAEYFFEGYHTIPAYGIDPSLEKIFTADQNQIDWRWVWHPLGPDSEISMTWQEDGSWLIQRERVRLSMRIPVYHGVVPIPPGVPLPDPGIKGRLGYDLDTDTFIGDNGVAWIPLGGGGGGNGIQCLNDQCGIDFPNQFFVNDSNVTISSSGGFHYIGWTDFLPLTRGGLGYGPPVNSGGIPYFDSSSSANFSATLDSIVVGGGAGAAPFNYAGDACPGGQFITAIDNVGTVTCGAAGSGTVTGTGTTGRLTKWTNGPGGVLGDSIVAETANTLTLSPGSASTQIITTSNAGGAAALIEILGGTSAGAATLGGGVTIQGGAPGAGGEGGEIELLGHSGTPGSTITITAGTSLAGTGGPLNLTAGTGPTGGPAFLVSGAASNGAGGDITVLTTNGAVAGRGGDIAITSGLGVGARGGRITATSGDYIVLDPATYSSISSFNINATFSGFAVAEVACTDTVIDASAADVNVAFLGGTDDGQVTNGSNNVALLGSRQAYIYGGLEAGIFASYVASMVGTAAGNTLVETSAIIASHAAIMSQDSFDSTAITTSAILASDGAQILATTDGAPGVSLIAASSSSGLTGLVAEGVIIGSSGSNIEATAGNTVKGFIIGGASESITSASTVNSAGVISVGTGTFGTATVDANHTLLLKVGAGVDTHSYTDDGVLGFAGGPMYFYGSASGFTGIQAAGNAGSTVFTLPTADAAGFVTSDGAGILSLSTTLPSVAFAGLGTPTDGTMLYCTDCDPTATLLACTHAGAQTGAFAYRVAGAWKCMG